jgi:hypothetical protein
LFTLPAPGTSVPGIACCRYAAARWVENAPFVLVRATNSMIFGAIFVCLSMVKNKDLTKSVNPMMVCGWLERAGYCAKLRSGGLFPLKTKRFLRRGALLWEVPFGG